MKYHPNAKLTVHQRSEMRERFLQGWSIKQLARFYHVNTKTVQRWIHREDPQDRSTAPKRRCFKRPPGLVDAVVKLKQENPAKGTLGIALYLRQQFPGLSRSRVRLILKEADMLGVQEKKSQA